MSYRVFRRFWLAALALPLLKGMALSVPLVVFLASSSPRSAWLTAFALIPLSWSYVHYLMWRRTTWTFDAERKEIVHRSGIVNQVEDRIPLAFPPKVRFSQSLFGHLLNFGSAELTVFGRSITIHQIGDFRTFKETINCQGLIAKEPSFLVLTAVVSFAEFLKLAHLATIFLSGLLYIVATLLPRLWAWLFARLRSVVSVTAIGLAWLARTPATSPSRLLNKLFRQGQLAASGVPRRARQPASTNGFDVNPFIVSYEGFLAFCTDFILNNDHLELSLDYVQSDGNRKHYPSGISPCVANIYFSILHRARMVIAQPDNHPDWILCQRINSLEDIKLRISQSAFNKLANWYIMLTLTKPVALLRMELEHHLQSIKLNN